MNTITTSGIRSNCAYHSIAKHIINIIRDPETSLDRSETLLANFITAFNIRHQLQLNLQEMVNIIRSVRHEETGRFAEAFMAPTLRELVHSTNIDNGNLPISQNQNNPVSGFEENNALTILSYLLNVNILVRCDALAAGNRDLFIEPSSYIEQVKLNVTRPHDPHYTCYIKNNRSQTHFETQVPPGATSLEFISMNQNHALYRKYEQCGTPSQPQHDNMIGETRAWIIKTQNLLHPTVFGDPSESTITLQLNEIKYLGFKSTTDFLMKFQSMSHDEKNRLEKKLIALRPEVQWTIILKDCLLFITLIGAYFIVKDFSKEKYFLSSERQASMVLAKL
jgi:hypothetical protein